MPFTAQTATIEYVFMAGMANSGSTLLAFLLNAHPEIVSVGEVDWVDRSLKDRFQSGQGRCSCGRAYLNCPFWMAVMAGVERRGQGFGRPRFFSSLHRSASEARLAAFASAVLDVSGKRIFMDASKKADYLFALQRNKNLQLRVINLFRDGEGVVNSWRKHSRASGYWLTRLWIWRERKRAFIIRRIRPDQVLDLKFEQLTEAPKQSLERVFGFLGVDAAAVRAAGFKSEAEHHIVGNQMRLDGNETILFDPDWRLRLAPELRTAFRRAGGQKMNQLNGYPGE